MSSHEVSYQDMTRAALIRMIERCCKGRRDPDDDEMAKKESEKKARLHEGHKGRGNAPPVEDDDVEAPWEDEGKDDKDQTRGKRFPRGDDEDEG